MNKQYRNLIIAAAALVVLVSALLVTILVLPGKSGDTQATATSPAPSVPLLSLAPADIRQIEVSNAAGAVTAVMQDGRLTIPELSGLPADQPRLDSLQAAATQLVALRQVSTDQGALATYGLDAPGALMTVTTMAGQTYQAALGSTAPASLGSYLLMNGTVYLVNSAAINILNSPLNDYISPSVTKILGTGEDLADINLTLNDTTFSLTFVPAQAAANGSSSGSDSTSEPVSGTIPAYYVLNGSTPAIVPYGRVTAWSAFASGLTASKVAAIRPKAADLAEFGLDKPTSTLSYTTTKGSAVTLITGVSASGDSYLMRQGVDVIYQVAATSIGWLNVSQETLLATLFPGVQVSAVQALTLTEPSGVSYALAGTGGAYTSNGAPITAGEFNALAAAVLQIEPTYTPAASAALAPVLTIELTTSSGRTTRLELAPTGSGALAVTRDGAPTHFTCFESAVETLLSLARNADGVDNTPTP
ncbi:MAG: DUF4340 domain-containing protein [Anaerolineae bacterium]